MDTRARDSARSSRADAGDPTHVPALVGLLVVAALIAFAWGSHRLLLDAAPNEANLRYSRIATDFAASEDGYAALGIDAHAQDDPVEVGRRRAEALELYLAGHEGRRGPPRVERYPDDRRIEAPSARCWTLDRECLAAVVPDGMSLADAAARHATLLERFDRWLSADDARMPVDLGRVGWGMPVGHLIGAARLRIALTVDRADEDGAEAVVRRLETDLSRLRLRLAQADSLLEKMIVARAVSLALDALALILPPGGVGTTAILATSPDERSMVRPFAREFQLLRDGTRSILAHQDRGSPVRAATFGAMRALLDVEATANVLADELRSQETFASLSRAGFEKARTREAERTDRIRFDPTNVIGSWLLRTAMADYTSHVAHMHALDDKIALLELVRADPEGAVNACEKSPRCEVTLADGGGAHRLCPSEPVDGPRPELACLPVHDPTERKGPARNADRATR